MLLERWCEKKSKWFGAQRRRWLVLTRTRLRTFVSQRGYAWNERPTEEIFLCDLATVRVPTTKSDRSADTILLSIRRSGWLVIRIEGSPPRDDVVTAVVNARLLQQTRLAYYAATVLHTFEPIGLVTCAERYALGPQLGHGSFGTVHQATCLQSGARVAVKTLRLVGEAQRRHAAQEVAILRRVRHPHVVRLLNYFEAGFEAG